MQLKVRRSQKSGMLGGKVIFVLDVRAELTGEEQALVERYKLWPEVVYTSEQSTANAEHARAGNALALAKLLADKVMKQFFTIKDLVQGQHIECKELQQVLAVEEQVCVACQNLKKYLELAQSFDGNEVVVEIAAAA
ncbi:MAG TPA: hypothetical protein VG943_00370 [Caulobacterales bacterium]|nr:hypothetical protein [Caulobacterales bacterium]